MKLSRRQLVTLGAALLFAGVVVGKVATTGASAAAESPRMGGVHIHGTLTEGRNFKGQNVTHTWDITVYGPDDNLTGSGWGANPDPADSNHTIADAIFQCHYTQQGAIQGDVVALKGIMLFSGNMHDQGGSVVTEANLVTGDIRVLGNMEMDAPRPHPVTVDFVGKGIVARI